MEIFKKQKKWLVTGGAGFIGSHLIDFLLENGQKIISVDDLSSGKKENVKKNKNLKFINKKIQDINQLTESIDGIFHLAAQVSAPKSLKMMYSSSSNNLMSSLAVFEIAKKNKIPIVYASSSAVYGNLSLGDDNSSLFDILTPYGMDKLTVEKYAKLFFEIYNIPSIGLRFFNVYGPRQDPSNPYSGVISIFLNRLINNKSLNLNGGSQTRDFIFVFDICKVIIKSMNSLIHKSEANVFNVGTGNSIMIKDLLYLIAKKLKLDPKINQKNHKKGDPLISKCSVKKLEASLGCDVSNFLNLNKGLDLYLKIDKISL
jgi:UDP-glucose 4-epimerase